MAPARGTWKKRRVAKGAQKPASDAPEDPPAGPAPNGDTVAEEAMEGVEVDEGTPQDHVLEASGVSEAEERESGAAAGPGANGKAGPGEGEGAGAGGGAVGERQHVRNKEKVLVLSSRGIVYRYRHLMEDMITLLPHCKKDSKLDVSKGETLTSALNELADLRGCSSCVYFETRKKQDLYLWLSKVPNGPSAKFHVSAVHTMAELKLVGNHLKGSRAILSFSPSFDRLPHLQLLKEMFTQVFGTPKGHRKSKPFFDHIQSFTFLDNHVWFRNYQIVLPGWEGSEGGKLDKSMLDAMTMVEVGPRFCLNPIRIFSGSFGGPTLFENPLFVSPNVVRAAAKQKRSTKYNVKVKAKQRRKQHEQKHHLEPDELADVWRE